MDLDGNIIQKIYTPRHRLGALDLTSSAPAQCLEI